MLAVSRFRIPVEGTERFLVEVREALDALAARPGFVRGRVGRATDDPQSWILSTEWDGVGAYRRALSSYDVKLRATEVFHRAEQEPSAFEVVEGVEPAAGG